MFNFEGDLNQDDLWLKVFDTMLKKTQSKKSPSFFFVYFWIFKLKNFHLWLASLTVLEYLTIFFFFLGGGGGGIFFIFKTLFLQVNILPPTHPDLPEKDEISSVQAPSFVSWIWFLVTLEKDEFTASKALLNFLTIFCVWCNLPRIFLNEQINLSIQFFFLPGL